MEDFAKRQKEKNTKLTQFYYSDGRTKSNQFLITLYHGSKLSFFRSRMTQFRLLAMAFLGMCCLQVMYLSCEARAGNSCELRNENVNKQRASNKKKNRSINMSHSTKMTTNNLRQDIHKME